MNWSNGKGGGKLNIILAVLCCALVLVLGVIVVADHRAASKETDRLTELAEEQKKGIDDYENVKKRAAELEQQSAVPEEEAESADAGEAAQDGEKAEEAEESTSQTDSEENTQDDTADKTDEASEKTNE